MVKDLGEKFSIKERELRTQDMRFFERTWTYKYLNIECTPEDGQISQKYSRRAILH
jgi:hypothetical protein